jgi:hypothetical protein
MPAPMASAMVYYHLGRTDSGPQHMSGEALTGYLYGGVVPISSHYYHSCDSNYIAAHFQITYNSHGRSEINRNLASFLVRATQVPEPSIIALLGLGLVGLGFARRRQA